MGAPRLSQLAAGCISLDAERARRACGSWLALDEPQRRALLEYADRSGLTLHLWRNARQAGIAAGLPDANQYEERQRKNRERLRRRREETAGLLELFARAGLRCAVLKGFTLEPDFVCSAQDRVQYDLDFYLSPGDAQAAFALLRERGYEAPSPGRGPLDHLPALVRRTSWQWRGDFFDVDIPAAVELHFQLWDAEFERIPLALEPDPLERLVDRDGVPALDAQDQLVCCSLHLLRHVFRGSLRLSHLYEIAFFLDRRSGDADFWNAWHRARNSPLRRACAAAFALATAAFSPRSGHWTGEIALLPAKVKTWIGDRLAPALLAADPSGKQEVLLQLSFVPAWSDRLLVLRRRLLPLALPDSVNGLPPAGAKLPPAEHLRRAARQARYGLGRGFYHLRALPAFARAAAQWWWD